MSQVIEFSPHLERRQGPKLLNSYIYDRERYYRHKLNIDIEHCLRFVEQRDEDLFFTQSREITILECSASGQLLAKYHIEKRDGRWFGYDKYDACGKYIKSEIGS